MCDLGQAQCLLGLYERKRFKLGMAIELGNPDANIEMSDEDFASMLEETFGEGELSEGSVVKGTVIAIEGDSVLIDVGLKSEGRVAIREFGPPGSTPEISAGDLIDVYLERIEDNQGEAMLSREKARREEAWTLLEKAFNNQERVCLLSTSPSPRDRG